jgi:HEAT repeat protein
MMFPAVRPLILMAVTLGLVLPAAADTAQVKKLLRQLQGGKAEKAASQLADLGQEALQELLPALRNKNWKVRYWAAYAVAYSKAAKEGGGVEALKPLLEDRDLRVRLRAAMALAKLGDKRGLPLARESRRHRRAEIRAEALAALAATADPQVKPLLQEGLEDSSPKVRYWALIGLRDLAGEEALAVGLKHLLDPSAEVKMAAMEVLGSAGKGRPDAEAALIRVLADKRGQVRQYAASVLARIGARKAIAALRKLRDSDRAAYVRDTADAAVVEITRRLNSSR